MHSTETPLPCQHVLLVGIDAYERVDPLHACVNDVDAIEAILLDRLGVPAGAVTKLVAPHPGHARRPRVPEAAPTSENIRAALEALAGDAVRPGDRVLIYYAGHGTQLLSRRASTVREALVPLDAHAGGALLYDYELNPLLRRIARRTGDVTIVLDCCCSAGATRGALRPPGSGVRFCRVDGADPPPSSRPARRSAALPEGLLSGLEDPGDPGYLVAAACQSNERAHEGRSGARRYGAFTAALLDRLAGEPDSRLAALRWCDIWQSLRAHIAIRYPGQHPWLIGRAERRLFGGPFRPQDAGIAVARAGERARLAAGTMVGLGRGARVAVYGDTPSFLPPVGSADEIAARLGVLEIEEATPSSCSARFTGAAFPLVEGARARLIASGAPDALVVALDPYEAALARWLEREAGIRVVAAGEAAGQGDVVEAFVGLEEDGRRWIGDELHGGSAERDGEPPLVRVAAGDREALLRGLLHYERYNLALRLPRRCCDLPGALEVRVLDCRDRSALAAGDLQDPPLPEARSDPERRFRYLADHGQPVCVVVENRSPVRLYASLINCAASGRVEILGAQLEIPPDRRQAFWLRGHLGEPFRCCIPADRASGVERIIAVGTTTPDADLSFLRENRSFAQAVLAARRDSRPERHHPRETWTATLTTMKITRPAGPLTNRS